jgi:putative pyruvate formate lyase activating enzyme
VKALRKRDARNVQALRLAHIADGKGVGADRLTPHGGRKLHPRGNPLGLPHQNFKLWTDPTEARGTPRKLFNNPDSDNPCNVPVFLKSFPSVSSIFPSIMPPAASYTFLSESEWTERIAAAEALSSPCMLCPRKCRADRKTGEKGICRAGDELYISSIFPHHGEEPPISGTRGSGTVFFSFCSLRCCFCQNFQISQQEEGGPYTPECLAEKMIDVQGMGVHNINLVTPTHFLPWILQSLRLAARSGLNIPIVWNSSGYELVEALEPLKGIVDIFLPDMKYGSNESSMRYCGAPNYVQVNQAAIREMFRQVGPLKTDSDGIAYRGMCIRHLVLPEGRAYSENVLEFLGTTFDPADISISLMAQYRPMFKAEKFPELRRGVSRLEYETVQNCCERGGFNGFYQEILRLDESFCIDFTKRKDEPLTGK